jgi:Uma2 family endonuclease
MNAPLGLDRRAFLQWAERQQGRFELKDARVIMHPRATRGHAWIIGAFIATLGTRLDADAWDVLPCFAVEVGPDIRCPDVLVERLSADSKALSTQSPVVIVEVLSPSSVGTDMVEKLAEYTSLPSLEAYIVASQDEPICWVWQRVGEDRGFPSKPDEIAGREAAIEIAALGVALPMSEIYRGIGTA